MSSQKNLLQLQAEVAVDKTSKSPCFCVPLLSNMQVLKNLISEFSVFKIMH